MEKLIEEKGECKKEMSFWDDKLSVVKSELNIERITLDKQKAKNREIFLKDFYENLFLPLKNKINF